MTEQELREAHAKWETAREEWKVAQDRIRTAKFFWDAALLKFLGRE